MENDIDNIISQLSPIERKVIPFLHNSIPEIEKKANLDSTSVLRALKFLENKKIIEIKKETKNIIDLGTNGIFYKKNNLPERKLIILLDSSGPISLEDAEKKSKLSNNEFKVSLGVLKSKALINLVNGKIILNANKEELTKKFLEEKLLDMLPVQEDGLAPEYKFALENLKKRKNIIEIKEKSNITFKLTNLGIKIEGREIKDDLIEEINSDVIKNWSSDKKLRKYDITAPVPKIYGGKKHFVNQGIEYAKKIWTDLGFQEMPGKLTQSSFWNFDALFTAQDHPVRELQDTFYIKNIESNLPEKKVIENVKKAHEQGVDNSKGWNYKWDESQAKKVVLRTHTTALSAQTLFNLSKLESKEGKFFAVGKCFRNETVDWSHGFEFNQTEGIVVDKNANFVNLLGYLKEFFSKMGFEKVKFVPAFFPYTEPSVEIYAYHPERKIWLELGGAGIFRPEVVIPLLGEYIPVLAWGPGFDRMLMDYYNIKDLREMYQNNINQLRNMKTWIK